MDTTLSPTDLFSPSKARQQRAQAADWAQIDSWLSYKYSGRTIPSFERNDETLKALRALCMANERADEERAIRERLERETLRSLEEREAAKNLEDVKLLETIVSHLSPTGQDSLIALAQTASLLNTSSPDPETLAHTLIHHTITAQNLTNHIHQITTLQKYLSKQLSELRMQLQEFKNNPSFTTPPSLQRQTGEAMRQSKNLKSKIREYEDRLSFLSAQQSKTKDSEIGGAKAVAELLDYQNRLEELSAEVEELEGEMANFANLPADREAARKEVGKLEVELDQLRRRRDGLFEGLVR
ncbi:hypothetical protein GQ43DRAFT_401530 [Delitschia confertaspora ATCC 74209]|uniref:HAUS augmin-like complex subunit 1 n=1 Tax=Delitschia confertaspora ATCC 74209 TaxID=1513339 RepID=A0A9P4MSL9_9PLEO|nr:hypothetical protein GQ43DRAFT_401530 [Delitschia confertaspora ATCC 74209]